MISKMLATALLSTALMTGMASAQNATTRADTAAATTHRDGEWRASKLVGVDVYNEGNEKIGDINDVILDKAGKASNVIIGVGGFLGIGQNDIKVEMSKLKFVDEPVRTSATTTTTSTRTTTDTPAGQRTTTTTGAPAGTTTTRSVERNWYPDHAVLSGVNKDQLKAMPPFKYD